MYRMDLYCILGGDGDCFFSLVLYTRAGIKRSSVQRIEDFILRKAEEGFWSITVIYRIDMKMPAAIRNLKSRNFPVYTGVPAFFTVAIPEIFPAFFYVL